MELRTEGAPAFGAKPLPRGATAVPLGTLLAAHAELAAIQHLLRDRERLRAELDTVQAALDYHLTRLRELES